MHFQNNLRRIQAIASFEADDIIAEHLFIGFISLINEYGYLFRSLGTVQERIPYFRTLYRAQRIQLYFDDYGNVVGHLFWMLAEEEDVIDLLACRLPSVERMASERGSLFILSIGSSTSMARESLKQDLTHLAESTGGSLSYIRRRGRRVVAMQIKMSRRTTKNVSEDSQSNHPVRDSVYFSALRNTLTARALEGQILCIYTLVSNARNREDCRSRIWRPLSLAQFGLTQERTGITPGLVTWAWVEPSALGDFMRAPFDTHLSRWRSGSALVIVDALGDHFGALEDAIRRKRLVHSDLENGKALMLSSDGVAPLHWPIQSEKII